MILQAAYLTDQERVTCCRKSRLPCINSPAVAAVPLLKKQGDDLFVGRQFASVLSPVLERWFLSASSKVAQFTTGRHPLVSFIDPSFPFILAPREPSDSEKPWSSHLRWQAVSIPLQCLCLAVFDAVLVHMLKVWLGWGFRVDWLMVTIVSHIFLKIWHPYLPNTLGWVLGVLGMW